MPERWERELRKLGGLETPASTRSRIDEGPRGEGIPPAPGRGQRIVAGVVAFAVFGGAMALALGAFDRGRAPTVGQPPPDAVVVTLQSATVGPTATMELDGVTVEGYGSSTCWEQRPGTTGCVDVVEPSFTGDDLVPIEAGRDLAIEGDADSWSAELLAFPLEPYVSVADIPFDGHVGSIPSDPGRYILLVSASWARGEREFFFPIQIVPVASPSPGPSGAVIATLDAPDDGSMPELTLTYGARSDDFFAQGGQWPGVNGFILPLLSFRWSITPGAPLRIEGDASSVEGRLVVSHEDGSLTDRSIPLDLVDGVAELPTEIGDYELQLTGTWPRGTAAYFVRIQIGEPEPVETSPNPSVEPGVVPDVAGLGEADAIKALDRAGYEIFSEYASTDGVAAGIVVSSDPPGGTNLDPGATVHLVVSGITVAVDGYLTDLACSAGDMMPFAHTGGVLEPAGESYIRVNVSGIEPSDVLVQVFAEPNDDVGRGIWNLERNGRVLAVIDWETLQGIACRGSGIGGV